MREPRLRDVILLRDRVADWDRYPFTVPAVRQLDRLSLERQVTFFVGENGSGKSTLLEAIAVAAGFGGEGGSQNFSPKTTDSTEAIRPLADALRLSWTRKVHRGFFLRAESLFNVASEIEALGVDLDPYGGKSLHEQSHGESFLALFENRFFPGGLYLLDEPEAALSPQRQLSLLPILHQLVEESPDTQFVIATHSPILLGYPDAQIFTFDGPRIEAIAWEQTEPVQIVRSFLERRDWWIRRLLDQG